MSRRLRDYRRRWSSVGSRRRLWQRPPRRASSNIAAVGATSSLNCHNRTARNASECDYPVPFVSFFVFCRVAVVSIRPSVRASVPPSVVSSVRSSLHPSVNPYVRPSIHPSVAPIRPSVRRARPSVCPFVRMSFRPFVRPSVRPPRSQPIHPPVNSSISEPISGRSPTADIPRRQCVAPCGSRHTLTA